MLSEKYRLYASRVKEVTDKVMSRVKTVLPTVPQGRVLVLNVGESHPNVNHTLVQMKLASELHKAGVSFCVANERPANILDMDIMNRYGHPVGQRMVERLRAPENRTRFFRHAALASSALSTQAAIGKSILSNVLEEQGTLVVPVDMPRRGFGSGGDLRDAATFESVRKAAVLLGLDHTAAIRDYPETIGVGILDRVDETQLNMVARNIYMKEACDRLSRDIEGVRVILLRTGMLHVGGGIYDMVDHNVLEYDGSLAALYDQDEEAHYLGVSLYDTEGFLRLATLPHAYRDPNILHYVVPCEDFPARTTAGWTGKEEAAHICGVGQGLDLPGTATYFVHSDAICEEQRCPIQDVREIRASRLAKELQSLAEDVGMSPN